MSGLDDNPLELKFNDLAFLPSIDMNSLSSKGVGRFDIQSSEGETDESRLLEVKIDPKKLSNYI